MKLRDIAVELTTLMILEVINIIKAYILLSVIFRGWTWEGVLLLATIFTLHDVIHSVRNPKEEGLTTLTLT